MRVGVSVGERFELARLAGQGGMGAVFEARDRETGDKVAIKIMNGASVEERARFDREARVLATLSHPAIVRYLGYGELDSGEPYLAMEWLSGEGLDARIARERLSVEETMALAERMAGALALAHRHGIVHRDIKPSNIFLRDGDVRRAMLLDFGIARRASDPNVVTRTGVFMGTPGYVAPEQARGDRAVNARADVFALGCVLFECLAGKPAFTGQHVVAVLAKVLFEEVPKVSALRPGVPPALDMLIARMVAKQPEERLADGDAVVGALARVANDEITSEPPHTLRSKGALGSGEQRLVSVILVSAPKEVLPPIDPLGMTMDSAGIAPLAALRAVARSYGARVEALADGSAALVLSGAGMATDQAAQAARCALALRAMVPDAPLVLVTGRGVLSHALPVGEGIDRAAKLLREEERRTAKSEDAESGARRPVRLDELTAELLEARFVIEGSEEVRSLLGEAQAQDGSRLLLGRLTPCVGRERELSTLLALYEECASEPQARAVLVTGVAGIGKSRIRHELLQKLAASEPRPEIWLAQGDPTRTGAPFGMAAELLRRASSLHEEDPIEVRREKIRGAVTRHLGADAGRVMELYGELVGAPWAAEEASTFLRAARKDPVLMGDQLRRGFEDFVSAASAARPVVLVLEDLHWADTPSVQLLDAALRLARERSLFVLALARPDVHERFPGLWADRGMQEIRLGELSRRASERLARHVLGDDAPPSLLARVVAQAAGNPFYLEELLRAVAEGQETALPKTVLAMLQARLEALPSEARWLLRAGSVFGETFWTGGVRALLGGESSVVDVGRWIETLVHRELLMRRRESRFPGEEELAFRHDLLRDVAYAALTEVDRALGHRLAAEWLEVAGERDAMVLAEHCERGEEREKAAVWFVRASTQALSANDFEAVLERTERAEACGADGGLLGEVRQAQAEAHFYRGELAEAARRAREAMQLLSPDSPLWFGAASAAAWAESSRGERRQLLGIAESMLERADREASPFTRRLAAMGWIARMLLRSGQRSAAETLTERFHQAPESTRGEPIVRAEWAAVSATRALVEGDLEPSYEFFLEAARCFEAAEVDRFGISMRIYAALVLCDLGDHARAEEELATLVARAEAQCLPMLAASARHGLAEALAARGALAEARALLEDILETLTNAGLVLSAHDVRQFLALVLVRQGDSEAAERAAIEAVALVDAPPNRRCSYLATLARVLLACGRPAEALSAAEEAMQLLEQVGALLSDEPLVRLVYAEALDANGQHERAKEALSAARAHLLGRAEKIGDPARRTRFLRAVPDNARTLVLAEAWLGASPGAA
ncbi:serine/threonine-protein kinase [Polyangium sp. 15x6]|uniref:serine/threonine-protein kinase n=1 Tax=Polyangium sp. 15x6 TaxID=3042687 RepID=UPI00249CB390|nr:serine/threonine-protein kinase [Polyangium sp. 15x6]MDI3285913.1 protein kinase [Polyangium sp. 15x6]